MATTAPATTASHFGFTSLGHYISAGFSKLKTVLTYTENKVIPAVETGLKDVEADTEILAAAGVPHASEALLLERALDSAAGELLAAIHVTDPIDGATTVDLKIGIDAFNAFKQFIADQSAALAGLGFKL